jgi:hypothetical protein
VPTDENKFKNLIVLQFVKWLVVATAAAARIDLPAGTSDSSPVAGSMLVKQEERRRH